MMDNKQIKNLQIAEFQGVELEIIDWEGKPWLKSNQIADALGYSRQKGGDPINRIYARNKEEFTSEMTMVIDVPLRQFDGGQDIVSTRVFSPRGCYLLGMFARTKKAQAFRRWVLDVLEGHIQNRQEVKKHRLTDLQQAFLDLAPTWRKIIRYLDLGLNNYEIARLIYSSPIKVLETLCQMEHSGILPPDMVIRHGYSNDKDLVISGQRKGCYERISH